MWSDNETNRDFLNFKTVADTVAEVILAAGGKPISMGVSGGWGVGKSSMIKLIQESLSGRASDKFVFVEFNAWLYQGYDDARAALMDVIARRLVEHGEKTKTGLEKAKEFLERINWFRAASLTIGSAISVAAGLPPIGLMGEIGSAARGMTDGDITKSDVETAETTGKRAVEEGKGLIKPKKITSPPQKIHDLREHFASTLNEMGVTLVVLVDDLDRCLPSTAISTLEAMRHFLFIENTAFVIAADDKMIRHAVRAHFKEIDLDDDLVTNYFDKLIQVPIRVPPLGTQEVRAYLFLLFIENSTLSQEIRDDLRTKICKQLGETWQGKRVDRSFVCSLINGCPEELSAQLELADRLAPIMTKARQIAGNPRLIKRFLNTLSIRLATAKAQKVNVDGTALAKMLLFERCGNEAAYSKLVREINDHENGKPIFLKAWEEAATKGEETKDLPSEWKDDFTQDWLALSPTFHDFDLRSVVYVSREHMPIITAMDQLSSESVELLAALVELKQQPSVELATRLKARGKREVGLIMERLLSRARQIQEWGTPSILYACLTVITAESSQSEPFVRFLRQIPLSQLKPSIIPLLKDKTWAKDILSHWGAQSETPSQVKKAISVEFKGSS